MGFSGFPLVLAPIVYKGRRDVTVYSDVYGGSTSLITYVTEHLFLAVFNATLYKDNKWSEEKEWRFVTLACRRAYDSTMYACISPFALYLGAKVSEHNYQNLRNVARELRIPILRETMTYDTSTPGMQFTEVD